MFNNIDIFKLIEVPILCQEFLKLLEHLNLVKLSQIPMKAKMKKKKQK